MRIQCWPLSLGTMAILLASCAIESEPAAESKAETPTTQSRWSWDIDEESVSGNVSLKTKHSQDADVLTGIGELLNAVAEEGVVDPVPVEELEKLLPSRIGGYRQSNYATFERSYSLAGVQRTYGDEDEGLSVAVADMGQFRQILNAGITFLLEEEVDAVTDSGFERTGTHKVRGGEYPYYEEFSDERGDRTCTIAIWVEERFMVVASGHGVTMELCDSARESFQYRRLRRLARKYAPSGTVN